MTNESEYMVEELESLKDQCDEILFAVVDVETRLEEFMAELEERIEKIKTRALVSQALESRRTSRCAAAD